MGRMGNQRLRVRHVIGGLQVGGAETLLYRLATWPDAQIEHEVICLGDRDWYSALLEQRDITVHHLGMTNPWALVARLGRLRRLIRQLRPDVIQSWMYLSNILCSLCARPLGIPVVWGIHASSLEHLGLPSRLCAYAGGLGSRWLPSFVVNCSERSARIHGRLGYSAAPGAVIPNGYDPDEFLPDDAARDRTRAALDIAPDAFVIGSIARWHSQKDIPNVLRATALLRQRGLPLHCLLVGRGLDRENADLLRAMATTNVDDLVVALGARADTPDLARAMDLHVLASSGGEAFPNVVAETMLSGTPNVVTDVGDAARMVGDKGWVVPPGNAAALADAIERAFRECTGRRREWDRRRAAGRDSIVDRFTFDRMAASYEDVWARMVGTAA